jgi:hypothetical protein
MNRIWRAHVVFVDCSIAYIGFFNLSHLESADDVCSKLEMLILINENDETEATITNGQSRDICNIVHTRHKTKIKKKYNNKNT